MQSINKRKSVTSSVLGATKIRSPSYGLLAPFKVITLGSIQIENNQIEKPQLIPNSHQSLSCLKSGVGYSWFISNDTVEE